jgi:hypothetical protein
MIQVSDPVTEIVSATDGPSTALLPMVGTDTKDLGSAVPPGSVAEDVLLGCAICVGEMLSEALGSVFGTREEL